MSAAGARGHQPVGSAAWITDEKENIMRLVDEEMEEIEFPVRHEMEWLNEHMAEIFSKNQFNLTEIFKTPGKMRGKTPRTARKRNIDQGRVPLSDIFSSNQPVKSPFKSAVKPEQKAPKVVPDEEENDTPKQNTMAVKDTAGSKLNSFSTYNTDSGYHGSRDEDEVVLAGTNYPSQSSTQPLEDALPRDRLVERLATASPSIDRRTTEGSFHSAQENLRLRGETVEPYVDAPEEIEPDEQTPRPKADAVQAQPPAPSPTAVTKTAVDVVDQLQNSQDDDQMALDNHFADIGSPSDGSTPDRPIIRKSSLSFASLPAREPLMTKKSMGGHRISRTSHIDTAKLNHTTRPSHLDTGLGAAKTTQVMSDVNDEESKMDWDKTTELESDDMDIESTATKLHHKSSTQRLHEKISLLGKMQPSRPTKSIPAVAHLTASHVNYPELAVPKDETSKPATRTTPEALVSIEKEDSTKSFGSPLRPNIPKSHTADVMENILSREELLNVDRDKDAVEKRTQGPVGGQSPHPRPLISHAKSASVSSPSPQRPGGLIGALRHGSPVRDSTQETTTESTTPVTSPKRYDGALSMSKSKLQSLMKTAKGLFTSSAGVSAAAKLEALSPSASRSHPNLTASINDSKDSLERNMQSAHEARIQTFSRLDTKGKEQVNLQDDVGDMHRHRPVPETISDQQKTTSNTQRTLRDKTVPVLPEKSAPATALRTSPRKAQQPARQATLDTEVSHSNDNDFKFPAPPSQVPAPSSKANDRRPVKPTREVPQKPKPQPVSIRVASTLSRPMPLSSTASLSSSVHESNPAPAPAPAPGPKQPTLSKKASTSSLQTSSSTSSFKSSVSSQSQRKAQLAAEKKKQEEREAARRKEEQKREAERKRVAQQQEEMRRQESKARAEAERAERERQAVEDPKKMAQRQAIEQRRLENARRMERQGSQQPGSQQDMQNNRQSVQAGLRADMGHTRPPSRFGSVQPFSRSITQPPTNPAKPAKRALDDESRTVATTSNHAANQAVEPHKRRKTEDEHNPPPLVRPTMAPPIRQSNIRKEPTKSQMFSHSHAGASTTAAHHSAAPIATVMHKNGPNASYHVPPAPVGSLQRPVHPMDMAKYTTGKIPFADGVSNPPHVVAAHKAPGQSTSASAHAHAQRAPTAPAKSSPQYPNSENIHLPEIATDSEDEDSDAEMLPVPKWAEPKELEALLRIQEGQEIEPIFGPIAPFSLEETFKADKKAKKFRERTSSANWAGPDGLTQDEIRRDNAERQRLKMNGGWTFGSG